MTGKKIMIIFLSAILLMLTACQSSQGKKLNDAFAEKLAIDDDSMKNYDTEIQDVNLSKDYNDVSFHVTQTFGDEKFLYIVFDVVFKDTLNFQKFTSEDNASPLNILISDKKENDLQTPINIYTFRSPFNQDIRKLAVDPEKKQVSYLITLDTTTKFQTITLCIPSIAANLNGSGEETIAPGPYFISWDANNKGKILMGEIEKTDTVGNVLVSSFGLIVDLSRSPYVSWEEVRDAITMTQDDIVFALAGSISGGITPSTGETQYILTFSELLNLNKLDSLQIGDQNIPLTEWDPEN